ncbi:MAG: division/cell wall cluster transcriptional repressor MraZ [Chitinispirillales bacterium]|nr:division/cell wall cluster transcriptional repressor MraZ [Chitinispirillales bacterium]
MTNFIGGYDYTVDAKGRVNVPAKFRKALSPEAEETFVVVRASNSSLQAFPKDVWDERYAKISALPKTPEHVKFLRVLSNTSTISALDVQGRIMLTPSLMEYAKIAKDVKIIGGPGYIELWDAVGYREYEADTDDQLFDKMWHSVEEQLAEQLVKS